MEKANLFNVSTAVLCEAAFAMKRGGVPQAQIARDLCLTQAAISQYIKGHRGGNWTLKHDSKVHLKAIVEEHYKTYPMVPSDWTISAKLCAVIVDEVG